MVVASAVFVLVSCWCQIVSWLACVLSLGVGMWVSPPVHVNTYSRDSTNR